MPDKVKDKSEYELMAVFKNDGEEFAKAASTKVAKLITDNDGEIVSSESLGTKELAYKIKGETHGVYEVIRVKLPADAANKISGVLNITDEVLRYLLVAKDPRKEKYAKIRASRKVALSEDESEEE